MDKNSKDLLLDRLQEKFQDSSKATLRSWIKSGRILVDGQIVKTANQQIEKTASLQLLPKRHFIEGGVEILYQDSHFVVIDKPEGLLSVATHFEKTLSAHAIIKRHFHPKKIYVVHRLDRETSGVMLFALSEEAFIGLKALFKAHDLERKYVAIVEGKMEDLSGTWQSYLFEDKLYVVHASQNPLAGELAITHYVVKKTSKNHSFLEVTLETGKKNQIRVHCQMAGHPVVGDMKYGAKTNPFKRVCLHAALLAFKHPVTGRELKFISPLPAQFPL